MNNCWYHRAGLGLFIHWGISAAANTEGLDLSWGMMKNKPWFAGYEENVLPPEEYWKLAEDFKADRFDPDLILAAARKVGVKYAVLTTRHHDGYALWPSGYGSFSTKQYLSGRDLVSEFVNACRRQGIKIGLYYSLSDWKQMDAFDPGKYESFNRFCKKAPDMEDLLKFENYYTYVRGQIRELLTRYGKIDILWFDHQLWNHQLDERMHEICAMIKRLQPHILINDRGNEFGDFKTPECQQPGRPIEGMWEACYIWQNGGWGYDPREEYRELDWVLQMLAATVSKGGNLLLNVGPKASGELPAVVYERFSQLSEWMRDNAPSVTGVGPFWGNSVNVPVTVSGNVWYLHVFPSQNGPVCIESAEEPARISCLKNGRPVRYSCQDGKIVINREDIDQSSPDEVLAVTWNAGKTSYHNEVFQFAE